MFDAGESCTSHLFVLRIVQAISRNRVFTNDILCSVMQEGWRAVRSGGDQLVEASAPQVVHIREYRYRDRPTGNNTHADSSAARPIEMVGFPHQDGDRSRRGVDTRRT